MSRTSARWMTGLALAGLLSFSPAAARAEDSGGTLDFSGYWKTIAGELAFPGSDDYSDILSRLRLRLDIPFTPTLSGTLMYDVEGHFGDFVGSPWFTAARMMEARPWLDLDQDIVEENAMLVRHGVYRAYVRWQGSCADVTAGRQSIDWGTGRAWNVTNPFFPANRLLIEPEERAGTDGVSAAVPLGALSRLELVAAGKRGSDEPVAAARYRCHLDSTDLAVLAHRDDASASLGGDFSRSVGQAELHGAVIYTDEYRADREYVRWQAGADYTFAKSLTLSAEYLYNGQGESDAACYDWVSLMGGDLPFLARDYGFLGLDYEITPLLRFQNTFIVNFNDGGYFLHPVLKYSLTSNAELAAGWAGFGASGSDEFALYPDITYVQFQWFF